jgi:hypothetical protein
MLTFRQDSTPVKYAVEFAAGAVRRRKQMLKHAWLAGLLLGLVLCNHAVGADASSPVAITVTSKVIRDHFGGVGFHADFSLPWSTPEHFDQVLAKRWRELEPSFARVSHWWLND